MCAIPAASVDGVMIHKSGRLHCPSLRIIWRHCQTHTYITLGADPSCFTDAPRTCGCIRTRALSTVGRGANTSLWRQTETALHMNLGGGGGGGNGWWWWWWEWVGVLVVMGGVGGTQVSEGRNVTKRAIIDVILLFLGGIRIF